MKDKRETIFDNRSLIIWKTAIASAFSWEVADLFGSHHPYLAPLTVILCLKTMLDRTMHFALYRFTGTIIGVLLIIFFIKEVPENGWILGLLLLGGSFLTKWLKLNATVIEQVALTILLVFALEDYSNYYAFDRIKDTFIGALFAIIINLYLFPSTFAKKANEAYEAYSSELSFLFMEFSIWIKTGCDSVKGSQYQKQLTQAFQNLQNMKKDLKQTAKVFSYAPFGKKKGEELKVYHQKTKEISNSYRYLLEIVGTFKDWGSSGTMTEEDKALWSNQMKSFSKVVAQLEKGLSFPQQSLLQMSLSDEQFGQRYHMVLFQETDKFISNSNSNS